jgi:hypothetical protein
MRPESAGAVSTVVADVATLDAGSPGTDTVERARLRARSAELRSASAALALAVASATARSREARLSLQRTRARCAAQPASCGPAGETPAVALLRALAGLRSAGVSEPSPAHWCADPESLHRTLDVVLPGLARELPHDALHTLVADLHELARRLRGDTPAAAIRSPAAIPRFQPALRAR